MPTSLTDVDSLLAIDVGGVTTRAVLFDIVDGRYRFLASASTPTTVNAPLHDIGEGIRTALDQLQAITGRILMGDEEGLIVPSAADGSGVDMVVATMSAGPPLKVVAVGLLEDVSLESARRLATTTYAQVVETISLNDRRKPEARLDAILRLRPDLVIVAGGTEGGASQSVLKLMESVGLASQLLPEGQRPELLFAGNQKLHTEIKSSLERLGRLSFAPNIRPKLDFERLEAAQVQIADLYSQIRGRQIAGVQELDALAKGGLMPTASAFGRIIRFLSKIYNSNKGVLGIDVGATATTVAGAYKGELALGVYPDLGLGRGLMDFWEHLSSGEVTRWLPFEYPEEALREYLYMKSQYPCSLPVMREDLAIEQAIARQVMHAAVLRLGSHLPKKNGRMSPSLLPWFEPIVASGSVLTRAPTHAQSVLMMLDGLQPTGITTLVLDQHHLAPVLGAAASINPVLAVQVLESSTFLNLGTVISPLSNARPGMAILRMRMTDENGNETSMDIQQGSLEMIPLPVGKSARLHLHPLHKTDIGMGGPGRGGGLRVVGGALGVIVDARGRPLHLPPDPARRYELIKKWLWILGG